MKTLLFVPVWNQIEEFPKVLEELRETKPSWNQILLINNGSTDGSEILVREAGYPYLDLPRNNGIGFSFMKAIDWGLEQNYDILGGLASNGKMIPSEFSRLIAPIVAGNAEYVTGSRYLTGGASPNLPLFRRISIPLVNIFVRTFTGAVVSDATCGYKAMKLDLFKRAQFDWHAPWLCGYSFEYYVFAKIIQSKIRWQEVPVTMRYPTPGKRYSKIKPLIGWYEMLKPWVLARFDGYGFD